MPSFRFWIFIKEKLDFKIFTIISTIDNIFTVEQHFYARHRIRLQFPYNLCVIENCGPKTNTNRYYPMELVEIIDNDPDKWEKQEAKRNSAFDQPTFRILSRNPTKEDDENTAYFRQMIGKLVEDHFGNYGCSICLPEKNDKHPNVKSADEESLADLMHKLHL